MNIPSLPWLATASLPEVVWVAASLLGLLAALRAWFQQREPRIRTKNTIRVAACLTFLGNGLVAAFNPPAVNPTWLSVLTPMVMAFGAFSMALLSVIDEQAAG